MCLHYCCRFQGQGNTFIVKAEEGKILKPTTMWLKQYVCPEAPAIPSEFIVWNFGFLLCLKIILLKIFKTAFAHSHENYWSKLSGLRFSVIKTLKIHFSILKGKFTAILHKILLVFSLIWNNWSISTLSVKTAQHVKRGGEEHKGFLQIKGTMSTNGLSSHLQLWDYYSFCKPFSLKTKSRMVESW